MALQTNLLRDVGEVPFQRPKDIVQATDLVYNDLGGVDISDGSQGLNVAEWSVFYGNNNQVILRKLPSGPEYPLFTRQGIRQLSLCFDNNSRPVVGFSTRSGTAVVYFYDAQVADYNTFVIPEVSKRPVVNNDDKRRDFLETGNTDVWCYYIKEDTLHYRLLRDRFTIEYTLGTFNQTDLEITRVGETTENRIQLEFRSLNPVTFTQS
jgi:hypothetical protein